MDAEENVFGRAGFYGWTQKKIFLGVQDFTDGRRRKSFWAYSILLTVDSVNASEIFPEFAGFRFPLLDKKIY